MREIKFRAWNTIDRKMLKWGDIFHLPAWEIFPGTPEQRAFDIMQYTGLKDKNGVEIYEGDIVKFRGDDKYVKGVVEFKAGRYIVRDIEVDDDFDEIYDIYGLNKISITFNSELEVIGNIHQTPELLKDDKC